jgi:hypothetical protein
MFCDKYLLICIYITMKKKVLHNSACNSIFELQWPFVIHYISTPMNAIEQVAWVARNGTHHIYFTLVQLITILSQLFLSTIMQLPYDYNHNVMLMLFLIHSLEFNMWHYEDFWAIFLEILISIIHYDDSF